MESTSTISTIIQTPPSLEPHQPEYRPQAWQAYTLMELGSWVHLFAKRAEHRSGAGFSCSTAALEKRKKDLIDARNYWAMMGAWLDALDAETRRLDAGPGQ